MRLSGALLSLVLLGCVSAAGAFTLERVNRNPCDAGARNLFWQSRSVAVDGSLLSPPVFRSLVDTARVRWNESVPTFRFGTSGDGDFCDEDDGVATLAFSPTGCDGRRLGDALAVTLLRWEMGSGRLLDADTVFTPELAESTFSTHQQVFLEVALHELGHVLGLDHSDACGASGAGTLMRSVLFFDAPRLDRPQDDDVNGARTIYPAGGGEPLPEGANSCAVQPARGAAWQLLFPLVAALPWRRFSLLTKQLS